MGGAVPRQPQRGVASDEQGDRLDQAVQKAATIGGIVIDTRARIGSTALIGSADEDRLRHLTVALPAAGVA